MQRRNLAVLVKLWALGCTILGISLTADAVWTFVLTVTGLAYLAFQRNFRLLCSMGVFYGLLTLLLYLIQYHGLHMVVFSEFYVLMFWNLSAVFIVGFDLITTPPGELAAFLSRIHTPTPVILGLLVMFRFFPTMKAEFKSVGRSMRNRGLTAPAWLLLHPVSSCEYVLVPMLLRCLQIADQLSVSAVARGAEHPGRRGSYYEKRTSIIDWCWLFVWAAVTGLFLWIGDVRV
ncbi:energy-coupling factor transporter transmembrane protein EcfT [Lacrimispora sp. NSJ-141]|uniref:Energy-coupling factor transporter transmembrane protein EcfT n=1 Tax=Lientehia hominis TaxID=2897778 RepID=A0AAP2RHV9_9FIRM|nr:energy-coupling factor transporter transmembrane component T [Lientehia hominis]MCD2491583.1 energy-coupling factor transporter transmembrane protein EcfT [Lientehia hominis]